MGRLLSRRRAALALLAATAIAFAHCARCDELLFKCDFASAPCNWTTNSYRGSFKGPLPEGLAPDHIARCEGKGFTEARSEDGFGYLRFKSVREGTRFIFSGKSFPTLKPGFYRIVVKGRAVTDPLRVELKTVKWIGTWYGSTSISMPEWETREHVIRIEKEISEPTAVALAFVTVEADVAFVALYRTDEKDYAAKFRRPPKGTSNLFTRRHFAFGLPNGWSLGCESGLPKIGAEGTALAIDEGHCFFWSAPFQPSDPTTNCTVRFRYKAANHWAAEAFDYGNNRAGAAPMPPTKEWRSVTLRFKPSPYVDAYSLKFSSGSGGFLRLDDVEAFSGDEPSARMPDDTCEVHLAPDGGDAATSNVQFLDEPARAKWKTVGAPGGSKVLARVEDAYGREKTFAVGDAMEGAFNWEVFPGRRRGAFLVSAWVEKDGQRISPVEELAVTRVARPAAWGRDAPSSYFGAHFLPRADTCASMKAAGVNWTRFHDSCTHLSGWYALEPEKGKWNWPDDKIKVFRDAGVRIFAQLGTTPKWASHFGEMDCKSFGYFERYMRPTNMVDWVNYVTNYVTHYKGQISDYFVWNEPWYLWWADGRDAKFYNRQKAGEDFGRLMLAAHNGVKAANPNATVCGFCTYADGGRWVTQVMQGGGYEACDQMDFHYYASQPRCRRGRDLNLVEESFKSAFKAHPGCKKPIYHTEGGAATYGRLSGLYRSTVPWEPDSKADVIRTADEVSRLCVSLLAEGVTRVFHYTMHCYKALGVKSPYLKLLMPDGKPHPALAAHAFMAEMLDEARFVHVSDFGAKGLKYSFVRKDGSPVYVYSDLSEREVLALAERPDVNLLDIFGNVVSRSSLLPGTLVYAAPGWSPPY